MTLTPPDSLHASPGPLVQCPWTRQWGSGHAISAPSASLGALRYGSPADLPGAPDIACVPLRLLGTSAGGVAIDHLHAHPSAPTGTSHGLIAGQSGPVRWRHDGQWLFGTLSYTAGSDLVDTTQRAYTALFQALETCGFPHPLRLWNYLPDINGTQNGLERYKQFNIGRQRAFLQAALSIARQAPAACALGYPSQGALDQDQVQVHVLASTRAALPIENPRQVPAFHYPRDYGPVSPTFSRATIAPWETHHAALFISGTASVVGHATAHIGDVRAQTQETLVNLQTVIDVARQSPGHPDFQLAQCIPVAYIRHAQDTEAVVLTMQQALGDSPFMQQLLLVEADVCREDLLVEVEAYGFAPLTSAPPHTRA